MDNEEVRARGLFDTRSFGWHDGGNALEVYPNKLGEISIEITYTGDDELDGRIISIPPDRLAQLVRNLVDAGWITL